MLAQSGWHCRGENMFEVNNLTKLYNGKKVLDDVSLSFKTGCITSLVGANGAGKSTLLSIMARLLKQDGGEVFFEGKNINEIKSIDIAKKVAVLRQNNQLSIKLTVRELVAFGRFPHSKGRLKKEDHFLIDQALDYLALTDMQHKFIDQLSGGQRQRAFVAMVVAQDTDHIMLDEPLNNLDMKHSSGIMKILRDLVNETKKTIIIVVHDINYASSYSDYIVALKNGKLILHDTPNTIMKESVIKEVFDVDSQIVEHNGQKICVYHNCAQCQDVAL